MSYHYRPENRKSELMKQLQENDNELNEKKKYLERLRLEAEFYEDKNKPAANNQLSSLADEIMNQLITNPSQPPAKYAPREARDPNPYVYQEPRKEEYKPSPQPQRQNHFINERELQKNKLQDQKHEGLFPTSNDHNKVRSYGKQQQPQPIPEKDRNIIPRNNNSNNPLDANPKFVGKPKSPEPPVNFNPSFNPFVKNEDDAKRIKQQRNREYLKALQEQRLEQQRKKEEQTRFEKQRKGDIYNNFMPGNKIEEKPLVMKKADPNSKPPKIQQAMINNTPFQRNLLKSKAIELKNKYKKGKIIVEQYERQLNNIRKQYGGSIEDLLEENKSIKVEKQYVTTVEQDQSPRYEDEIKINSKGDIDQLKKEPAIQYPIKNQSLNYSQFMPSMVHQPPQPQYFPNNTLPPTSMMNMYGAQSQMPMPMPNTLPSDFMEMMYKMFNLYTKQMKELHQTQLTQVAQGQIYQQIVNKLFTNGPGFQTMQIPPIQASQQRQFYSDNKQHRQYFDKEFNTKKKVNPSPGQSLANIPFGESDTSDYNVSLSAIASKIPLNNVNKVEKKFQKESAVDQFYNRKYKVKKLQKFPFLIDPNQSILQIPSTSSYLRGKNAKQQLKYRFEQDLVELRNMKTNKGVADLAGKLTKNTIYSSDRRILKEPNIQPVESASNVNKKSLSPFGKRQSPAKENPFTKKPILADNQVFRPNVAKNISPINYLPDPHENLFLKRHISNDENIMTFNEKEMMVNPSNNNYSPESKKEILEQDEYQTEPRVREESQSVPNYIEQYQKKINMPHKALNFIKENNNILSKYEKTEESNKYITIKQDSEIKESSSKDYFSNNQISPVKKSQNYYQQSLETIRSDYQPAKNYSVKPIKASSIARALDHSKSPKNEQLMTESQKRNHEDFIRYSQTVESIEESSARNSRPPIAKKRSVGKKKQSSIARSKINADAASISKSYNIDESVESYEVAPRYQSNVCESQYEDSIELVRQPPLNPQLIKNSSLDKRQKPQIVFNPPTIIAPRSTVNFSEVNQLQEPKVSSSKLLQPQGKWKSLQQARKLAKQGRAKIDDPQNYRSVEQKFSELQSFITKKEDSVFSIKKQNSLSKQKRKKSKSPAKKNANIMKMLEELEGSEEDEYRQDFESYREESEQYQ